MTNFTIFFLFSYIFYFWKDLKIAYCTLNSVLTFQVGKPHFQHGPFQTILITLWYLYVELDAKEMEHAK